MKVKLCEVAFGPTHYKLIYLSISKQAHLAMGAFSMAMIE